MARPGLSADLREVAAVALPVPAVAWVQIAKNNQRLLPQDLVGPQNAPADARYIGPAPKGAKRGPCKPAMVFLAPLAPFEEVQ
jgi:hypothetical protein